MIVFAPELERVLAAGPRECIRDLIRVLFLESIVTWADGNASEKVVNRDVLRTGLARIDGCQREKRILQAQIVHQSAADRPCVGQRDLAIVDGLRLIENRLR